jgi:hypothetical protein
MVRACDFKPHCRTVRIAVQFLTVPLSILATAKLVNEPDAQVI